MDYDLAFWLEKSESYTLSAFCLCKINTIDGLVVKALDTQSRGPVFKTTGCSKVDSACHHSEVGKTSTSNFWELSGKK